MSRADANRRQALAQPGLRSVRRPQTATSPAFDLSYVRQGAESGTPVLVIPGGPGLASVLPHALARSKAPDLDLVEIEHRGVGLSRHDPDGAPLPRSALSTTQVLDDIVAVLDAEKIGRAVVAGSSYGSYLAQALAARHPDRVHSLVLDSAVIDPGYAAQVKYSRALLFEGNDRLSFKVRDLLSSGEIRLRELGSGARIMYEFGGPRVLDTYLNQVRVGAARRTRAFLTRIATRETEENLPYVMEFDIAGEIAFRELGYGLEVDGGIFDQGADSAELRGHFSPFEGPEVDVRAALPSLTVRTTVISGDLDLRTPRPVAEEIASAAPGGELLAVPGHGHSALDTFPDVLWEACRAHVMDRAVGSPARLRRPVGLGKFLEGLLLLDRVTPGSPRRPSAAKGAAVR